MGDHKNQMRPIARNLKAAAPPRFAPQTNQMPVEQKISATFKASVLEFQSVNKVRISHIDNGPFLFYVQVEASDKEFEQMQARLQKMQLQRLKPQSVSKAMACLAFDEKKIFRAAVLKIPQHSNEDFYVNFVDFGFNKSIKFENLFYIPGEFLTQCTFAKPFALVGSRNAGLKVNDREASFYFRYLVANKSLTLKCVPPHGQPICQYCELLIDNKVNVLDQLKRWDPYSGIKFRPQKDLDVKVVHDVKVSYVDSAQEFYIHLQKPEILLEYDLTCDELFQVMPRSPIHRNPKSGSCCAVFFGGEFYRGIVVGAKNNQTVQVKIIDFGIIEEIPEKNVHLLTEQFVERPAQAYRACLKGFENQEIHENISTQFEIFCGDGRGERKVFKMVIHEKLKDAYLVELEDRSVNPFVNVNKLLLKNSRPLIETIQIENAKKRHKDVKSLSENHEMSKEGNNASHLSSKHPQQNHATSANNHQELKQQQNRTHFGKSKNDGTGPVAGTYFQSSKEASVWGSKESTPSDHNSIKSSDWDQPKNISREQNSSATWNESNESHKNQKAKNGKGAKQKSNINEKKMNGLNSGWVSTLLTVNRAFVHYDEHVEGLQKILDEMFAFYENNSRPHMKDLHVGDECAVRSSDGNWYRSKIDSINGDKVKVFHREYGNSETVSKSKIRVLEEKFAKINNLAVSTFFPVKPLQESDENSLFNEMMKIFENGAKEFNFKVVQKINDGFILEPIDPKNNKNVIDELVKAKKALRVSSNELQQILENDKPKGAMKKERKSEKPKKSAEQKPELKSDLIPEVKANLVPEVKNNENPQKIKKEKEKSSLVKPQEKVPETKTDRVAVKMTALTSPTDFYITKVDEISSFVKLHGDIQIIAAGAATLKEFEEGTLCLAQQPFDLCWYRAKIIDFCDETEQHAMITVRSLDDGKTFSVDDKTFLKKIPSALESKKFFGIACSLPVKIERKCEELATDLMMSMMEMQLQAVFISDAENECKKFVELFFEIGNVSDVLVDHKFAHRLEIIPPGKAYTSHINSLSSFYIQFEIDQLKLDLISQYFEEANGNFDKVEAKEGTIVAALFPDDECWYRARLEQVENSSFSVTFIDYGNTCLVKQIGRNSEPGSQTIWELAPMSRLCFLAQPKSIKSFSDKAEAKFVEICANGATILDVKCLPVNPGEAAQVELYVNGKNIIDELIPLCEIADGVMGTVDSN